MAMKIISCVALFVIFLLSAFLASSWKIISELNNFHNVNIKSLEIDGNIYTMRNGDVYEGNKRLFWFIPEEGKKISKVLDLGGFYMWDKEDPLFDSPDLNVNDLKKSVDILNQEQ